MKNIYSVSLLDIMPDSLKADPDVRALADAITPELQEISMAIQECILLSRIDDLPSDVIDPLAWQYHVDFYDHTLPIETRREIVKNSLKWHRIKGTPDAVDELINTVFEDGRVVEWFEYGGEPYHFKVVTNNTSITTDQANEFLRALNTVKNTRSYFEGIELNQMEEVNLYFAGVVHTGENIRLWQVK